MTYYNILMIDDDEDDQEIFVSAAEKVTSQANCVTMSDASEALRQLNDRTLQADVIFLDLNMPIMSGQEFLIAIKKNSFLKKIPIIILSTSSHTATIQLTKDLGAEAFITKPDRYEKLVNVLKPILLAG